MELKILEINNIASIESARIDFGSWPLANESVFLICGETGSGKSTILDAICLALYNQAPRLASAAQEWIIDDALPAEKRDSTGDIGTNDPRQFLRKGTAEASVRLVFTGVDGVEYTAFWCVRRAYGKAEKKIQDILWTVSREGGEVLQKRSEVKAKVEQATGMTFDQYCRTSMLAQGEFSKFLKSSENEKADILEKLTRTDVYARIGARIARKAKECREALQRKQELRNAIPVMDPSEKETMLKELAEKEVSGRALKKTADEAALKLRWLQTLGELEARVESSRSEAENAGLAVASGAFAEDEKLCKDWDATADSRAALSRKKELEYTMAGLEKEETGLKDVFISLSSDMQAMKSWLSGLYVRYENIDGKLSELKDRSAMYESAKSICDRLQTVISERRTISDLSSKLAAVNGCLEKSKAAYSGEEQRLKVMRGARGLDMAELERLNDAISSSDKEGKTREKERTENEMALVKEAGLAVRTMLKAQDSVADADRTLRSYLQSYEASRAALLESQEIFARADSCHADASALFDRMKDSMDSWARVTRSRLHTGDICPLCGQKIESLTSDTEFAEILAPLKDDLALKATEKKNAEAARNDAAASVKAWETSVGNGKALLAKAEEEYSEAKRTAETLCAALQLSSEKADLIEELRGRYKSLDDTRSVLAKEINEIAALEQKARQVQDVINRQNRDIESGERRLMEAAEEISVNEKEAVSLQTAISSSASNIDAAMKLAGRDIVISGWHDMFDSDPESFVEELMAETGQYSRYNDELAALSVELGEKNGMVRDMEESREKVTGIFPLWEGAVSAGHFRIEEGVWEKIRREWVDLYSRAGSLKDRKESVGKQLSQVKASLDRFMTEKAVPEDRLAALASMTPVDIQRIKDSVEARRSAYNTALSVLAQRESDLEKHRLDSPGLSEDDTVESIKAVLDDTGERINSFNQEIGAVVQKLAADDENIRLAGKEDTILERLREESDKWNRLYELFGDAEGRKFKRIAQGFVMSELIRNANLYLERLSGRYLLDNLPGSLTLTIRDMMQGGTVRSVNTLSGGETFLVSLSLALGLSSLSSGSLDMNILFIDEGFGTLSSDYLDTVMEALENLHQMEGRKVGIISHVESLRERISTQIRVKRKSGASSTVEVVSA